MTPHRLFKFVDGVEPLESLLSGGLKFTPPAKLNDPSEMVPIVYRERYMASLADMRRSGHSPIHLAALQQTGQLMACVHPEGMAVQPPTSVEIADQLIKSRVYDDFVFMSVKLAETARNISEKVGVQCLTSTIESLPMWAHYAKNARGFVLEYTDLGLVFSGDSTGVLNEILKVDYDRNIKCITMDPTTYSLLFRSKMPDWSYEREYRIVRLLTDCREIRPNLFIHAIDPSHIVSVICGWNMSDNDVGTVRTTITNINPSVAFKRASFNGQALSIAEGTAQ